MRFIIAHLEDFNLEVSGHSFSCILISEVVLQWCHRWAGATSFRPKLQWPRPIHLISRKYASEPLFLQCESVRPAFCQYTSYEYFDRGAVICQTSQERWPNNMGKFKFHVSVCFCCHSREPRGAWRGERTQKWLMSLWEFKVERGDIDVMASGSKRGGGCANKRMERSVLHVVRGGAAWQV